MEPISVAPKGEKSIYVRCAVWYDEKLKEICITAPGANEGFVVSVSNKPGTVSYYPTAYNMWKKLLVQMGRWPDGIE